MEKRIFLLPACQGLGFAKRIERNLSSHSVTVIKADIHKFRDGEFSLQLRQDIQGKVIFIVQQVVVPGTNTNENLFELLLLNSLVKLYKPKKIINVIPYLPYARQDRIVHEGDGLSIQCLGNLLKASGADQLLVMEIHSLIAKEMIPLPTVSISPAPVLALHFRQQCKDMVVVSPDKGAMQRCRDVARLLQTDVAFMEKIRPKPGVAKVRNVKGAVKGKTALFVDDMIDSGGTLAGAVASLKKAKARQMIAACAHALFSDPAPRVIKKLGIKVVGTNTIPQKKYPWYTELDVSGLFADAIIELA